MSNSMMIKGKNTIMNERIWINCVVSEIVFQPLHSDTDTSKNPINGVETTVRDGRGFNMTLDAHSFESVSYTHLRAHETKANLVCRLLLEKKK